MTFDLHLTIEPDQPLSAQVESKLRDGIRSGTLRGGVRLPSSRALADQLSVSRGVVVEAYSQLVAEGYLVTNRGDGTRVTPRLHSRAGSSGSQARCRDRIRFDLRAGLPDPSRFPRRAWNGATGAALRQLTDAELLYGSPRGMLQVREAVAEYLGRTRGAIADPADVFVTSGTGHALGTLWPALRGAGVRRVAFEDPSWTRVGLSIRQAGLEAVPTRVDGHGLVTSDVDGDIDAVVVSPAHQYPTGAQLSPTRRCELLDWAQRTGGLIVEDDYDAEYRHCGPPMAPLQSFARSRVIYLGTTSKTLAPGLRLGWAIIPDRLADAVEAQQALAHALPSVVNQAAYADLISHGVIDRHLRSTRRAYTSRRELLLASLERFAPELTIVGAAMGLHVLADLPEGTTVDDEAAIAQRAADRGIAIEALHLDCAVVHPRSPALLIGYGAITESAIPAAVRELAACVQDNPRIRAAA